MVDYNSIAGKILGKGVPEVEEIEVDMKAKNKKSEDKTSWPYQPIVKKILKKLPDNWKSNPSIHICPGCKVIYDNLEDITYMDKGNYKWPCPGCGTKIPVGYNISRFKKR